MPFGIEMTTWTPGSVMVMGVVLIVVWSIFWGKD